MNGKGKYFLDKTKTTLKNKSSNNIKRLHTIKFMQYVQKYINNFLTK
jgi:hypothetical protein